MKKAVAIVVLLGVLALLGRQVYRRVSGPGSGPSALSPAMPGARMGPPGGPRPTAAVAVEVAPVQKTTVRDLRTLTGSLRPKSQFTVAPKVAGRLEKLLVSVGDTVRNGQLIAVLDSAEYALAVEQARAELEVAQANVADCSSALDVAKRQLERILTLRERGIASQSELDEADARYKACEAKHKIALAQVAQKQAALEAALVRLSYTQIHAAWQDDETIRVVGERFVDEGALLAVNQPIVSLLDISSLKAEVYVIERDYTRLRTGQTVVATTDAHPGREFPGTVARIAPLLKETSRQARVEVEVPNPELLLKPGMFVRLRVELERHEDATAVPFSALARRNGQQGVFLLDRGSMKARFVPVEVGIVTADLAEIIQPPLEGEVVTLGHHLLEDGSAVLLSGPSKEGKAAAEGGPPGQMRAPAQGGRP